jgi:hypothetical protein
VAIVRESGNLFDVSASSGKTIKYSLKVCAILHGNDSKLIFLIDPYKESLILIVENTSSVGPISIESYSFEESVSLFK